MVHVRSPNSTCVSTVAANAGTETAQPLEFSSNHQDMLGIEVIAQTLSHLLKDHRRRSSAERHLFRDRLARQLHDHLQ